MAEHSQENSGEQQQEETKQDEAWQPAQYEDALADLERLQEKINALRSTLPSLVAPLVRQHSSKAQMFAEIRKAAIASTTDLKAFGDDWDSDQTRQLLGRAKESEAKDADLSKANEVANYGLWKQ